MCAQPNYEIDGMNKERTREIVRAITNIYAQYLEAWETRTKTTERPWGLGRDLVRLPSRAMGDGPSVRGADADDRATVL